MNASPSDPHRPAVHVRPARNWINDPNGLAFHDGHYHVFFQYNPHGAEHADMHWGHQRSADLIHWEPLPVALAPTPGGPDADGCFSGNAVSVGDRMLAFYSAHRADRWWQPVVSAESRDAGLTWHKRPGLVIADPPAGTTMFRDPYVWPDGRGGWRMLVGASLSGDPGGAPGGGLEGDLGGALLYESPDLEHWSYRGPFLTDGSWHAPGTGGWTGFECPQYATFGGDRGALIVSLWDAADGPLATRVYAGAEQDGRFVPTGHRPLDHGPDFYAPALLPAPDGRWLLWGWAWEARDPAWTREAGWAGTLTVPREVTLTDDGVVRQRPARELAGLRAAHVVHAAGESAGGAAPADLGEVDRAFDLTARLAPGAAGGPCGLRLATAPDEHLDLLLDPAAGHLVVDRDHASADPRAHPGRYPLPAGTGPVELRVIVDGSIVEVFLTTTGATLTLRCYPVGPPPWRLQVLPGTSYEVNAWDL